MQPLQNNNLHEFPSEKGKGLAGTIIFHGVLLLLLIMVSFSVPPPPEVEEGILVNFGTDNTGMGMIEPSPPARQEEASPPANNSPKVAKEEPLLTQNSEEAPEVKKIDPDAERRKAERIEADRKLKEELESERVRKLQAEIERKRIEAEQQRQADIMDRTKKALANSKNAGTSSTSEGNTGGTGNQGSITGSVNSNVRGEGSGTGDKGVSYNLEGRGFQSLPVPDYKYQDEGKVVVEVSVDRTGKVIQATAGIKGSTTLKDNLLKVARDAAMRAKFEAKPDAPVIQKGTITYNFILK